MTEVNWPIVVRLANKVNRQQALVIVSIAACLRPGTCDAQLTADQLSVASFQFNLSNPGARSLGMGGAFAGLADDATSAYANPAGLTILTRPEVSYEGRNASFSAPFIDSTAFVLSSFSPTGDVAAAGSFQEVPLGEPKLGGRSTSFLSFVYPHRRWTLALYRHQLADLSGGIKQPATRQPGVEQSIAFDLDIAGLGLAGAYRFNEHLALGVALVRYEASIGLVNGMEGSTFEDSSSLTSDASTTAANFGLLARIGDRWSAGAFFRQGPSFATITVRSFRDLDSPLTQDIRNSEPFRVPDVVGIGIAWKATPSLLVMAEWDRIGYSSLGRETLDAGRFRADDADEYRVGIEFSFWHVKTAPAFRLGAWFDPEHKVRFEAAFSCPGSESRRPGFFSCSVGGTDSALTERLDVALRGAILESLFRPGEDSVHFTVGFGMVPVPGFQIDMALDYVDAERYTFSLSGVVRF